MLAKCRWTGRWITRDALHVLAKLCDTRMRCLVFTDIMFLVTIVISEEDVTIVKLSLQLPHVGDLGTTNLELLTPVSDHGIAELRDLAAKAKDGERELLFVYVD